MNVYVVNTRATGAVDFSQSVDDGATWSVIETIVTSGESPYGFYIDGDEQKVLFAAGAYYSRMRIWKSVNGGVSFAEVYYGDLNSQPRDMAHSPETDDIFWTCGRYGRVFKSTNWGNTWTQVAILFDETATELMAISFASDLVGWAVSTAGWIYKSTDGGTTWTPQFEAEAGILADVFAVSESVVWVLPQSSSLRIWKTENGGTDWTGIVTPRLYNGGRIFASGEKVWFTGRLTTNLEICRSINGGDDWSRVAVVDSSASGVEYRIPIHFVNDDIGFVAMYRSWKTTDGGQTFSEGGICTYTVAIPAIGVQAGVQLLMQVRSFAVTEVEPADRTIAGTTIMADEPLNFGETPKEGDSNVKCIIFRIVSFSTYSTISNMKFYLYDYSEFDDGSSAFYADITDTWTQNKTPAQVKAGTPGTCPNSLPSANLTKIGGGDITGVAHADTSQYIYLVNTPGALEDTEVKDFQYRVRFDYV